MALSPIPIQRYLVPEVRLAVPDGFRQVDQAILGGLPHTIRLDEEATLVVVAPNGLAVTWRNADPTSVVSQSAGEVEPVTVRGDEPLGSVERAPARLLMRLGATTVASVPLIVGLQRTIPNNGRSDRGVRIELIILSWDLRAGSLRGVGDFGSHISLAWRRADQAVAHYSTPPINPHLIPRLEPQFRMESRIGLKVAIQLPRFQHKKVI